MSRMKITLLAGCMIGASASAQDFSSGNGNTPPVPRQNAAVLERPLEAEVEETLLLFEFEQHDRMTLPISLGGRNDLNFMIDTGAERSAISQEMAIELGLKPAGERKVMSFAGLSTVSTVEAPLMSLTRDEFRGMVLLTFGRRAIGADGVLGVDSLQDKTVTFDFANREMRMRPSIDRPKRAGSREVSVNLEEREGRMIISDAEIDGLLVDMIIDTGSAISVGNFTLRDDLRRRGQLDELQKGVMLTFTGQLVPVELGSVRNVDVDGFTIARMPVAFVRSSSFSYLGYANKPVLYFGMEAMRAFEKLEVDFANKQAIFKARDVPGFNSRSIWWSEEEQRRTHERTRVERSGVSPQ